jgi:hypothetical protein
MPDKNFVISMGRDVTFTAISYVTGKALWV